MEVAAAASEDASGVSKSPVMGGVSVNKNHNVIFLESQHIND